MLNHTTLLISKMDPIKYIFEKPALTGRIARWQMLLSEYDIEYRAQKSIKGSVLAEYLAHQPIDDHQSIRMDFPDEDIMYLRSQDWDEPFPEEGPDPESKWGLFLMELLMFMAMELAPLSSFHVDHMFLSLQGYVLTVQTILLSMKLASCDLKRPLI